MRTTGAIGPCLLTPAGLAVRMCTAGATGPCRPIQAPRRRGPRPQLSMARSHGSGQYYSGHNSPIDHRQSASPAPYSDYGRPSSSHTMNDMAVQLAPGSDDGYGSQRSRYGARPGTSSSSRAVGLYDPPGQRSKSVADPSRQYTRNGQAILHFGKSLSRAYGGRG